MKCVCRTCGIVEEGDRYAGHVGCDVCDGIMWFEDELEAHIRWAVKNREFEDIVWATSSLNILRGGNCEM